MRPSITAAKTSKVRLKKGEFGNVHFLRYDEEGHCARLFGRINAGY
jgi:hypothetical protein